MSLYAEFEFECDCDGLTPVKIQKPGNWELTFKNLTCSACGSEWEIRMRQTPKGFAEAHRLLKGSAKLGEHLKKKQLDELCQKPVKKPFKLFMPGDPH